MPRSETLARSNHRSYDLNRHIAIRQEIAVRKHLAAADVAARQATTSHTLVDGACI